MKNLLPLWFVFIANISLQAQYAAPVEYSVAEKLRLDASATAIEPVTQLTHLNLLLGDPVIAQQAIAHIQTEIGRVCDQLGKGEVKPKQYKAKTEAIQLLLDQQYFKTYDPYAGFEQIFKRGAYNGATASAFYGLVLDYYKIPYTIKVEPRHIYPVADPSDQRITLPVRANLGEEPGHFQSFYFKLLKEIGLVTLSDLDRHSEETIWTKYYGPKDEQVELSELAGIIQYQKALSQYKKQDYRKALEHINSAEQLYNSPRHQTIRYACLYQLAELAGPSDPNRIEHLAELYQLHPNDNIRNLLMRQFMSVANQCLVEQGRPELLQAYFRDLRNNLSYDSPLSSDVEELYLMQMAKYYARNSQSTQLVAYLDSICIFHPQNAQAKEALSGLLVESLRKEKDFNAGIALLDQYHRKYLFLKQNSFVQDIELYFRGEQIRQLFNNNQENEALQALGVFEDLLSKYDKAPRKVNWVTTAYAASSYFYFRSKNYTAARELVERALAFAPGDAYLENQLDLMRAYEKG